MSTDESNNDGLTTNDISGSVIKTEKSIQSDLNQ